MNKLPNLSLCALWNISFGFFGVQVAYALQSANISRIFTILGSDPHNLSYFWILPPLAGIIVQPIVGILSDRTWTPLGRRKPYLIIGSLIAVIIMLLLPNAGSFGLAATYAMLFGAISLMLLDTSINIAMQPFKMMVGDMVNEKQKKIAFSIQSFLCNAGSLIGYLFPFIFSFLGVSNVAPVGEVPDSVIYSFYIGALILMLCVFFTSIKVKEYPPCKYMDDNNHGKTDEHYGVWKLLKKAPSTFWTVGLVQFFCWGAFMLMWTYTTGAIAGNVFDSPTITNSSGMLVLDTSSVEYESAADWVGVLFAVQAIGSVFWAMCLPAFKKIKVAYALSLVLGGVGFISIMYLNDKYALFFSFLLISCAWSAMLAIPFTILTNSLNTIRMGTYLGMFNATICLPQIVAAILGGGVLKMFSSSDKVAPEVNMLTMAGISLLIGAICVVFIKTKDY
ncbi:MFS transporter [Escherichia coli]|nr:MFS transporter [Escherichia coli]